MRWETLLLVHQTEPNFFIRHFGATELGISNCSAAIYFRLWLDSFIIDQVDLKSVLYGSLTHRWTRQDQGLPVHFEYLLSRFADYFFAKNSKWRGVKEFLFGSGQLWNPENE